MYHVGERDRENRMYGRRPWGMLVQRETIRTEGEQGYEAYNAVVLDQVLQDIEADYRHRFKKLKLFSV